MIRGKKGQQIMLNFLVRLAIGAVVVTIIFSSIYISLLDSQLFSSLYVARDTGLLVETMQTIPYDISYEYPGIVKDRNIRISENDVRVSADRSETDKVFSLQSYALTLFPTSKFAYEEYVLDAALFSLEKQGLLLSAKSGIAAKYGNEPNLQFQAKQSLRFIITSDTQTQSFANRFRQELQSLYLVPDGVNQTVSFVQGENFLVEYSLVNEETTRSIATAITSTIAEFSTQTITAQPYEESLVAQVRVTIPTTLITEITTNNDEAYVARQLAINILEEVRVQ